MQKKADEGARTGQERHREESGGKTVREITPLSSRDCLFISDRSKNEFTYPVHCHSEYELNFIEHAAGARRMVGDSVETIGDYDLVLISGCNLEHVWESHECKSERVREITIQFSPDLFQNDFFDKKTFESIRELLKKAERGVVFPLSAILKVYNQLDTISSEKDGFYSVIKFLTVLYELSRSEDIRVLSESASARVAIPADCLRVQQIQAYINENYKTEIRLPALARMAGMSPVAFSRFFKMKTGKSLSDYIIDVRLGYASRFLVDTGESIADICYDCGFNNLSNFNRIFRKKKNCSPKEFRGNFRKKKKVV